ncbi:unnamed protein product [Prorocentrum cordatum]|uniref:Reverse transcriptase domain-containing protein n=1 Tax=Prorocentrum cordatum TaxID=2364126 RepID=A0ABN9QM45_9DINO|nr:unnamed protein product [Polarella glacialis]
MWLLSDTYHNQGGSVNGSGFFHITRGVKQGDVLSSFLFNSGLEHAVKRFKDRVRGSGTDVGGSERLAKILYADDLLLYAAVASEAMFMLKVLCEKLSRCGLALNASKAKVFTNDTGYSWLHML